MALLDDRNGARPSPALSPEEVVRLQVAALQQNDAQDSGIRVAFRFASPANRAFTGPIERFIGMVKNPTYQPMLSARSARFGPMRVAGDQAEQSVTVVSEHGEGTMYRFLLSRQEEPRYRDCWMTNGVILEGVVGLN